MFWQSSVLEIQDMMEAYNKQRKQRFKDEVLIGFATADAIATRVAYFFTEPKKRRESDLIHPWNSFPSLFTDPQKKASENKRDAELEKYKANMKAYAERWNRRFRNGAKENI